MTEFGEPGRPAPGLGSYVWTRLSISELNGCHLGLVAPGEQRVADGRRGECVLERITPPLTSMFDGTYELLRRQFEGRGQIEPMQVVSQRFVEGDVFLPGGWVCSYEMIAVHRGGKVVGARDHWYCWNRHQPRRMIVYLSHIVVRPEVRGRGLGAWLRAAPLISLGRSVHFPEVRIQMIAECDVIRTSSTLERWGRIYGRAGYFIVDPRVRYWHLDVVSPEATSGHGALPGATPMLLGVRQVGRESLLTISSGDIQGFVCSACGIHAREFGSKGIQDVVKRMLSQAWPDAQLSLLSADAVRAIIH